MRSPRSDFHVPTVAFLLLVLVGCGQDGPGSEGDEADDRREPPRTDAGRSSRGTDADAGRPAHSTTDAGPREASSGAPDDDTIPATFDTLKLVIAETTCFGAGCHNDDQNPLNLRVDDELYTRLRTLVSESCGDLPVLNPGKPQESALVRILKGPCGETARMPLGCVEDDDANCVPGEYVRAIERWIAAGAPQK